MATNGKAYGGRWALVVCAAAAIAITVAWPRHDEPEYAGKPLSEWLLITCGGLQPRPSPEDMSQASRAVQHIGTNALPYLLKWISHERPAPTFVQNIVGKLPFNLCSSVLFRWLYEDKGELRAALAVEGFENLGTNAESALPELERMARSAMPSGYARGNLVQAIASCGPRALPVLFEELGNNNQGDRHVIVSLLGITKWPDNSVVVPCLISNVEDRSSAVRLASLRALGAKASESSVAFEALLQCLNHTNAAVRHASTLALGDLGRAAAAAIPALTDVIRSSEDGRQISDSVYALEQIATNASVAVPALVGLLRDSQDARLRAMAARALASYADAAASAIPELFAALDDPDESVIKACRQTLWVIAPNEIPEEWKQNVDYPFEARYLSHGQGRYAAR
ncbi:MAG TPA: HEAT repeat domain-containing protein [Candidatus Dormibacteraeota bacterium]|nr:HEAT repeat domain-containing protein [Candidatus Dormibacteraeota bacterium]